MRQMTIGKQIALMSGALVGLGAILGLVTFLALSGVGEKVHFLADDSVSGLYYSGRLDAAQHTILAQVWEHVTAGKPEDRQRLDDAIAASKKQLDEYLPAYLNSATTDEDRALAQKLGSQIDAFMRSTENVRALSRKDKNREAEALARAELLPAFNAMDETTQEIVNYSKSNGDKNAAAAIQSAASARAWVLGLALATLAVGISLTFLIARGISRALKRTAADLGEATQQVASAAVQVSGSSQALAQGASEQAASIEETSASAEEITSMTRKNAENSRVAAEHMVEAARTVGDANRTLEVMVSSMSEINASSDKISKIIKVIDEIAFQTNILALNAAVEAARAGEAGMGFAVVADEVRNLAQRSAQAAKDTTGLIEESIAKTTEGTAKLDQVATAIRAITDSATKVKTLVDEIKVGSEEQARGIEQIAKAISQLEQLTQKAAANAEESAAAGEEMTAQAATLTAVVGALSALAGAAGAAASGNGRPKLAASGLLTAARPQAAAARPLKLAEAPSKTPALAASPKSSEGFPLDEDFKEF